MIGRLTTESPMRPLAPISALYLAACSGGGAAANDTATAATDTAAPTTHTTLTEQSFEPSGLVDVLLVIDDSTSMSPYLELLGSGFPAFTRWVLADGLDGRIGVTTTSVETAGPCGHPDAAVGALLSHNGHRWIDASTPEPLRSFPDLALTSAAISGCDRGLTAARLALDTTLTPSNADFRREGAALHVVMISDDEDHSDDPSGPFPVEPADLAAWLETLAEPVDTAVHSLVCSEAAHCTATSLGQRYLDASGLTGGVQQHIGDLDSAALEALGSKVAPWGYTHFGLDTEPDPATLDVLITDAAGGVSILQQGPQGTGDYVLLANDPQVVWLHTRLPAPDDRITIRYEPL